MKLRIAARFKKYIVILFIMIGTGAGVRAQTRVDEGVAAALQSSIESMLTLYKVKGISAAAYIPRMGMWKGVAGDSHDGMPIDTTMLLSIGSVTKTFVASEILKLEEAGLLSLSDTLGALLPPMANVNPGITVSQLLSHTSGMGEYLNSSWQTAMNSDLTAMWYFPSAFAAFSAPAVGGPGSPFRYCNTNYALLGMIIEAKKGDSLHHILRNDFLSPLKLGNIHMEMFEPYSNTIPHNWSTPTLNPALAVDAYGTPHQALWSSAEPAGGYFSDPANLALWGYNLYSGNVLSAGSLSKMLTFSPVTGSSYFSGYGLGAMLFNANGRSYWGHAGNYFGYAASMMYYPKDSLCVVVLINQDCIATYEARSLMDVLIRKLAVVGVKEQTLDDQVAIRPNPVNTSLTITAPVGQGNVQVSVTDVSGKEVYRDEMQRNMIMLNTSGMEPGTYFIKLTRDGQCVTKQVVVQH